jgi:hypothetical protein
VSFIGLVLALILSAISRTQWEMVAGVVEVSPRNDCVSLGARSLRRLPFAAITFGHLVIGCNRTCLESLRAHEHTHVRQYERWGVFFLIAYPVASAYMLLLGRHPYIDNPFEVHARNSDLRRASDFCGQLNLTHLE